MSNADMDSTKTETVAPKPHPITIGLAFVSPFLGVIAAVIGIYSLFQNQRAVTLSQQAYLSVADPQLFPKRIPPQLSSVPVQNGESLVRVGYRFTLHNFGNTPATLDELTTHFYFPGGWTFKGEKNGKPAAIAPQLDFIVDTGTDAVLDTNALTAFDKQLAVIQRPDPESPMPLLEPRRRNLWVTDTLQWRRKPGSLSLGMCAGFSSCCSRQLPSEPVAPSRKRTVRQG